MNTLKSLVYPAVVLLSLAAAATAHAESPTIDDTAAAVSGKSLAQVQAERFQARADGSVKVWSTTYNHMAAARSVRARADVRAEAVAANRAGFDAEQFGEDSGSFALARVQPVSSADRVLASR